MIEEFIGRHASVLKGRSKEILNRISLLSGIAKRAGGSRLLNNRRVRKRQNSKPRLLVIYEIFP